MGFFPISIIRSTVMLNNDMISAGKRKSKAPDGISTGRHGPRDDRHIPADTDVSLSPVGPAAIPLMYSNVYLCV